TFAIILVLAEFFYVVRMPYSDLVFAVGEFRGTRNGAFFEAGINIVISVILVQWLGIVGVAIGTLIAMSYRTLNYVVYLSKHILNRSAWIFAKKTMRSLFGGIVAFLLSEFVIIPLFVFDSFVSWAFCACCVTISSAVVLGVVEMTLDRREFIDSLRFFKN
ncbi:MAG: polysaccharide biosynthesis C-terminal domain-containing protein, partial [Clostridia bacterium]|nr:polysaccharide biosynthesis C-terminal domain-containing protein [Clostridia bacterium]